MTGAARRHGGRGLALVAGATASALTALLLAATAGAAAHLAERGLDRAHPGTTPDAGEWRPVLLRAWEAAQERRYTGEALWIVWADGEPHVTLSQVLRDRDTLTVSSPDHFTVRLGDDGGDMVDHRQGWLTPLPPVDVDRPAQALGALDDKYEVALTGEERLLDRPCTRVEVRQRADGSLRERFWVDDDSGLVLRRESYEGSRLLRLVTYLSLDLRSGAATRASNRAARDARGEPLERRSRAVSPVDDRALAALREAGWTVPPSLPGAYEPVGVYAVDGSDSQPLHVVYRDGLYTVSLFQQQGKPDWASLPDGAEPAGLGWQAYEWPGAVPQRLVWEASGTTFSLVGDAPPEEFTAIARSLPRPQAPTPADRLRRGLSRLWEWVSP